MSLSVQNHAKAVQEDGGARGDQNAIDDPTLLAEAAAGGEVHGPRGPPDLARRNRAVADGRVERRVDLELVVDDGRRAAVVAARELDVWRQ